MFTNCAHQSTNTATKEVYLQVATRSLSDVAMVATAPVSESASLHHVELDNALLWIDGQRYTEWTATELREQPLAYGDPMLSDVYYGFDSAAAIAAPKRYASGHEVLGVLYWVDARVCLWVPPAGSPVSILEKPLSREDTVVFETALAASGFDSGIVDGVINEQTRQAVGAYLGSEGVPYRFANSVINVNLFKAITGRTPQP